MKIDKNLLLFFATTNIAITSCTQLAPSAYAPGTNTSNTPTTTANAQKNVQTSAPTADQANAPNDSLCLPIKLAVIREYPTQTSKKKAFPLNSTPNEPEDAFEILFLTKEAGFQPCAPDITTVTIVEGNLPNQKPNRYYPIILPYTVTKGDQTLEPRALFDTTAAGGKPGNPLQLKITQNVMDSFGNQKPDIAATTGVSISRKDKIFLGGSVYEFDFLKNMTSGSFSKSK